MYDADQRKLLSALAHGSIFFSAALVSVGIPIVIMLISTDPVVKENAKEAINFHFNVWLYGLVVGAITFVTFGLLGFILFPVYFLFHWGLAAFAIYQTLTNFDVAFRYPFIFRVL